jgi:hypothetical protein
VFNNKRGGIMKAYGMWLPTGKLIDTDKDIPDIIIMNSNYLYKVHTDDNKSQFAGIKEIEVIEFPFSTFLPRRYIADSML